MILFNIVSKYIIYLDDFADTTPPPPKKTKAVVEKHKKSSSIHSDPTLYILKTSQLGDSSLRSKKTR